MLYTLLCILCFINIICIFFNFLFYKRNYYKIKIIDGIQKNSQVCIYVKDKNHRFNFVTDNFEEFAPLYNVFGFTDYDFFPKDIADKFREGDLHVRSTHERLNIIDALELGDNVLYYNSSKFMIDNENMCGVSIDITNEIKKSEKVQETNNFLTHINYIIRHDLYNSINLVNQFFIKIEKKIEIEYLEEHKIIGAFKALKQCIFTLKETFQGICDFSIMLDDHKKLPVESFYLSVILNDFLKKTAYYSYVDIDEEMGIITANKSLMITALINLIKNGIKHNNSQNKKVKIYKCENDLLIEDNGYGITDEQLSKFIKPYSQANDNGEGLGLGLSITNLILKYHNLNLSALPKENGTILVIKNIFI